MTKRFTDVELVRIKDRNPISSVIGPYVTWDRAKTDAGKGDFWACCPFHAEATPSFHCLDGEGTYKCFGCGASGDQIRFLQEYKQMSFVEAVEHLGGEAEAEPRSPEEIAAEKQKAEAKRRQQERYAEQRRREEIDKARMIFGHGGRVAGTEGVDYLKGRGLMPLKFKLPLRFNSHLKYWHSRPVPGRKDREFFVVFAGPAMLAPITGPKGEFLGVHITYIDPSRPGKKISFEDPVAERRTDGKPVLLVPKKIRGSKRNASIKLLQPEGFSRLVIGEGWETTLSVAVSEYGTEQFQKTAYWTSIDLQSMGGKAKGAIAHPDRKNRAGKPERVPGPVPDMNDEKALQIPDQVTEVIRLGDGDSDRFTAEQVMQRANARWDRPGRTQRTAWAPDGMDFNNVLVGAE
ncbi:MAG: CHC2 zinc finger domain-containing protein [Pseudomonadota bacterium]